MRKKRAAIFIFILILLGLLSVYYPRLTGKAINEKYEKESVFVKEVIDGDTIVTKDDIHVRLLGINTPEKSQPYYREAKDFLEQIENKTVEILRDNEDKDKYNRKLRYVFYNDHLLNAEILQQGLATSFMLEGLKYEDKFKHAEDYAKDNEMGLWERRIGSCAGCIKLLELNYTEEFFILRNMCPVYCYLDGWTVKDDANHIFKLENLNAEEERKYESKNIWNDDGDRFFMRDEEGKLVIFYGY